MDLSLWAVVATGIATAALACITWGYAHSTARIATSTAEAARWARETAEAALVQSALIVQPRLLQTTPLTVELTSSAVFGVPGAPVQIPISVETTLRNHGPGPAINALVRVVLWDVELRRADALDGVTIPPGAGVTLRREVAAEDRERLALAIAARPEAAEPGVLEVTCEDGLGYIVVTGWTIAARDDSMALVRRRVEYREPAEENRDRPVRPLSRLWPPA
jgi:hypothetical protein